MKLVIVLLSSLLTLLCACSEPSKKDIQDALRVTRYRQDHNGKFPKDTD
jgi:hypothetical protein